MDRTLKIYAVYNKFHFNCGVFYDSMILHLDYVIILKGFYLVLLSEMKYD